MRKKSFCGIIGLVAILASSFFSAHLAIAARIAVFGDNSIDNFLADKGNTVSLVDMAFLEKPLTQPGSLNDYDVFIYTRNWSTLGVALSPAAALNVHSFVTGNVVLFMSDLADMIDTTGQPAQGIDENHYAEKALLNAVNFVSSGGKGYIGEFNGAALALTTNNSGGYDGLALGLLPGTFTGWEYYENASQSDILQPSHPVAAGLPNPWDMMGGQEYLFPSTQVDSKYIVAMGPSGLSEEFPTIIASLPPVGVPEPASFFSLLATLGGLAFYSRRKSPRKGSATPK